MLTWKSRKLSIGPLIRKYLKYSILVVVGTLIAGVAWAAFSDKGKVFSGSFTVGSADIKLLEDLGGGTSTSNLKDELIGPVFHNISPTWQQDFPIKIYNNGSTDLSLASNANYSTANDPDDLRSYIYVEPFIWHDNGDGIYDISEQGASMGKKSIIKWKTEGFSLGDLNTGEILGLILHFSTEGLGDTKQGKSGVFDFEFSSVQL